MAPGTFGSRAGPPDLEYELTQSSRPQNYIHGSTGACMRACHDGHTAHVPLVRQLKERLTPVLNYIDYDSGDIAHLIAEDLAAPAAERELKLLPRADYFTEYFGDSIAEACKSMIRDKIQRCRLQYAHRMVLADTIDVVVLWECPKTMDENFVRWVPSEERVVMQEVHACRYKYLNWDLMYTGDNANVANSSAKMELSEHDQLTYHDKLPDTHKGGFYAHLSLKLWQQLKSLSPLWGISVEIVVPPKLMTADQMKEMEDYRVSRCIVDENLKAQEDSEKTGAEREAHVTSEEQRQKRRTATYARTAEASATRYSHVDVHVDQGGLQKHT